MIRLKLIVFILAFLIIVFPALSFSGEVNLPKTGQTICYDANGNVIDCANTGQDADIQAGEEWPSPRFGDNGDGTVTDNLTGLMWLKDASCLGEHTWQDALNVVANFNTNPGNYSCADYAATYTDWIVPNIVELESLVNVGKSFPYEWLITQGFTNVQSSYYWSSTTIASNTSYVWGVYMYYGYVKPYQKAFIYGYYVWPVRGGQ